MNVVRIIALRELRTAMRNRWVLAATLLLAAFGLSLVLVGSAPTGTLGSSRLAVAIVSLTNLGIFLVPLIALLLSFDAVVGDVERGTMLLLLAHPVERWQVIGGKFLGHLGVLAIATVLGYGAAAVALIATGEARSAEWIGFTLLLGSTLLLGASFIALGYAASVVVRERATAAGLALGIWIILIILFDLVVLGVLAATRGEGIPPGAVEVVLMLNPADVYRLLNFTSLEGPATAAGLAGMTGDLAIGPGVLLGVLVAWIALPLGFAWALFHRMEL